MSHTIQYPVMQKTGEDSFFPDLLPMQNHRTPEKGGK